MKADSIAKPILYLLSLVLWSLGLLWFQGCDSASNAGLNLNSITQIPQTTEMVTGSNSTASTSLAAPDSNLTNFAVSGTAPRLSSINSTNVDTYFWNGLITQINNLEVDPGDPAVAQAYFEGEGTCYMAQNVMFSFANIQQNATTLCYMQNLTQEDNAITIISGASRASEVFEKTTQDKVVKVIIDNLPVAGGSETIDMNIFFLIYGLNSPEGKSGYAFNMGMCPQGSSSAVQYQEYRINDATGAITGNSVETSNSQFTSIFSGFLTTDGSGNIIFDTSKDRSTLTTYKDSEGGSTNIFKNQLTISGDVITNLNWNQASFSGTAISSKQKILSQFAGTSLPSVSFPQGAVAGIFSGQTHRFGTEFQSTHYGPTNSSDLYNAIVNYDFSDSFFEGPLQISPSMLAQLNAFDCTVEPDIVVSIDSGSTIFQNTQATCETGSFDDISFCNGSSILQARQAILSSL